MSFSNRFSKYIGTRGFYKSVFALVLPLIIQQGITNFVSLLDNVMVGRLGTEAMSSVAIVNQLLFVFNLTLFGGLSGASIFGAQYHGSGDVDGVRHTFRFRLLFGVGLTAVGLAVLLCFGDQLIVSFLHEQAGDAGDLGLALSEAQKYLRISLWGLVPFMLVQCLSSTLRDTGETVSPMIASVIAIFVNLVLNYIFIFGKLGAPVMGVAGAALATVIARVAEIGYLVLRTYRNRHRHPFIIGALRTLRVPRDVVRQIVRTGFPLLVNECLWSLGTTLINRCYSLRGLSAVAATNINGTVWQVFSVMMMAMGSAIAILVGQQLGAGHAKEAVDIDRKLIGLALVLNTAMGLLIIAVSGLIPQIYNVEPETRALATQLLVIAGLIMPVDAYTHCSYFTLRSGGKTFITFLFDCVFTWAVCLPVAFLLSQFTDAPLGLIYLAVQLTNILKAIIGGVLVRTGIWVNTLVHATPAAELEAEAEGEAEAKG